MASPASSPAPKRQKRADDATPYELIYWPGLPGRGEHVRLCFEEAGVAYSDSARGKEGAKPVVALMQPTHLGEGDNPPIFAPPVLRHGELLISQLPNILLYLGPRLGLVPDETADGLGRYRVNELALTALDGFSNEVHDCHHPVATGDYYENQKEEAVRKSQDYVSNRLPKFLGYFERVLQSKSSGGGAWLHKGQLSYADLVLFQVRLSCAIVLPHQKVCRC
jgi:glutathione S-transferase